MLSRSISANLVILYGTRATPGYNITLNTQLPIQRFAFSRANNDASEAG